MDKRFIVFALLVIFVVIAYEGKTVYIDRPRRRRNIYALAVIRAQQSGKRLMVIGNPHSDNYAFSTDYGCGDVCIDISGCAPCYNSVTHDLNKGLGQYGKNEFVVFVSCTLEYLHDIYAVYNELLRISGGDVFIVAIEPYSFKTLFARNLGYSKFRRKWRIIKSPPTQKTFLARPL